MRYTDIALITMLEYIRKQTIQEVKTAKNTGRQDKTSNNGNIEKIRIRIRDQEFQQLEQTLGL